MKNQPREKLWRGMSAQAIFTPRERAARKRIMLHDGVAVFEILEMP